MSDFIINIYIIYLNKKVVRFNNGKIPKKPASGEAGIWWLWLSRDMKGEFPV